MSSPLRLFHKIRHAAEAVVMAPLIMLWALGVVLFLGAAHKRCDPTYFDEA